MMRFFYPASRAHHAYCMALDFGMKFEKRDGFWTPEGILTVTGAGGYNLVVAKESHHLMTAQVGDVLYSKIGGGVSIEELISEERAAQTAPHVIQRGGRIIQRNGIPFHWPDTSS